MNIDLKYVKLAQQESEKSLCLGRKVGCILVSKSKNEIFYGVNTYSQLANRPIHAEIVAISALGEFDINGGSAYVTYAPCVICAKALLSIGIKRIICPFLVKTDKWYKDQLRAEEIILKTPIELVYHRYHNVVKASQHD